jgi:hypothetical protein
MTTDATRPASAPRLRRIEGRLPGYRYGLVLVLLMVSYVVAVAAPTQAWARLLVVVLQELTLLAAMGASRVHARTVRIVAAVMAVFTLAIVALLPLGEGGDGLKAMFFIVSVVLVGVAPTVIVRGLMRRGVIDVRTVLGALCVYVLIGMLFAYAYATIGTLGADPFFAQMQHATISDYLYFSFVTLTTVGYGDLTAAGGFGRASAVMEALLGQIYLVTVVAVLVGAIGHRRLRDTAPVSDDAAHAGEPA